MGCECTALEAGDRSREAAPSLAFVLLLVVLLLSMAESEDGEAVPLTRVKLLVWFNVNPAVSAAAKVIPFP